MFFNLLYAELTFNVLQSVKVKSCASWYWDNLCIPPLPSAFCCVLVFCLFFVFALGNMHMLLRSFLFTMNSVCSLKQAASCVHVFIPKCCIFQSFISWSSNLIIELINALWLLLLHVCSYTTTRNHRLRKSVVYFSLCFLSLFFYLLAI